MYLLIDGQALQTSSSRQRGIGRYAGNLLRTLTKARPDWRMEIVQSSVLQPIAAENRNGLPVLSFQPPLPLHFDHHGINERYYADWLTARGADGVLILSHCENWEAVVPSFCGRRPYLFGIAYDFIPLLYPQQYLGSSDTPYWYALRLRQLLQSDALLAISEATASDLRTLRSGDTPLVRNISGAVDPLFAPLSPSALAIRAPAIRKRFGLHRDFLLYVGAPDYRKNMHGAIRAYAALPAECREALDLAVVCRMTANERRSVQTIAQQAGVASSLRVIGSAGDEELRALYQMCRLFFLPSLYEGLGLPVLEALHCGAPVVASNCSALPEHAGPYSWLVDPTSPRAMAQGIQQALTEPRDDRRHERELFARTFSWQRTAERACTAIERVMQRRPASIRQRRRLAWVAPFTKDTRLVSERAEEMLALLEDRFDIELIVASAPLEIPEALSNRYLVLTAQEVLARHSALPYDMFVYHLCPPRHLDMLELLRRYPGLVVLHSFSAADLFGWREMAVLPSSPVLGQCVYAENDKHCASAYAAWIESAIARHEQSDGMWRGFAVRCLADCSYENDALIDSWSALRARGQKRFASDRKGTAKRAVRE